MARAYRGPYARQSSYEPAYATAAKWGTGVNDVHSYYGEGPPLRTLGRADHIGSSPVASGEQFPRGRNYQQPGDTSGMDIPQELTWGYPVDYAPESFGSGAESSMNAGDTGAGVTIYLDDRPHWGEEVATEKLRTDASTMSPWGTPGGVWMRALREGSARYRTAPDEVLPGEGDPYRPISAEQADSNPTETVSEGWENKVTSFVADANPSDPKQYEVQTSMRQRYLRRNNRRATMRATDDDRWEISSRVMAMVKRVYSEGERNYDMFPFQIDQIDRPFKYRTAGVGRADWMTTNEFAPTSPIRRTPPPDPADGVAEVGGQPEQYGYTAEDMSY